MPVIIQAILEALAVFGRAVLPYLLRLVTFLKLDKFWAFLLFFIYSYAGKEVVEAAVRTVIVVQALVLQAALLLVFWTWASGSTLRELFSANPLSGAPAGALYLASYAFPLKFMFGTAIAFIIWRLSFIKAAIVMHRSIKFLSGF